MLEFGVVAADALVVMIVKVLSDPPKRACW
jgi:hypothetical protein